MATSASPAVAAAAATTVVKPPEGRVHVAITDESYHPRQLWLAEKVGQTLPGVALYAVDSFCVCSVNNFKGAKPAAATAASKPKVSSQGEFREAQVWRLIGSRRRVKGRCELCSKQQMFSEACIIVSTASKILIVRFCSIHERPQTSTSNLCSRLRK